MGWEKRRVNQEEVKEEAEKKTAQMHTVRQHTVSEEGLDEFGIDGVCRSHRPSTCRECRGNSVAGHLGSCSLARSIGLEFRGDTLRKRECMSSRDMSWLAQAFPFP